MSGRSKCEQGRYAFWPRLSVAAVEHLRGARDHDEEPARRGDAKQPRRLPPDQSRAGASALPPAAAIGSAEHSMRAGFLSGSCVLALASFASPSARAGIEPSSTDAARSIAADAVVCVEIPQPDRLIDRVTDPRFQDYLKLLPQYQKLLKDPKFGELRAVVNLIAAQLDTTWDKGLRELTGGGIMAALEADPGQEPRVYLLITPRNKELLERANQVLLKLARQDAKDKGKPEPVKTSDHRGVVVHALGGDTGVAYGLVAGKLAISNSVKNLERLIDRMVAVPAKSGEPARSGKASFASLAERAEWKALKEKQDADSLAWGFADMDRLRQLDPKRYGSVRTSRITG